MILETIFIWVGFITLLFVCLFIIVLINYLIVTKYCGGFIEWKALAYAISSNMKKYKENKDIVSRTNLKVGRKWWIRYKGKDYLFECVRMEERK